MHNPAIYFDFNRKCVLLVNDDAQGKTDYCSFESKKIQLLALPHAKFHTTYKIASDTKPASELAASMLRMVSNGVSITPAARFALEQVLSHPTTQEAPMAIPTTLKPATKKVAPVKCKKLSEMIEEEAPLFDVSADGKATAHAEPTPKLTPAPKTPPVRVAAPKLAEVSAPVQNITPEPELSQDAATSTEPTVAEQAAQIVADAQAEASKLIQEMKTMLEDAKRKAEEKKLLEKARADAKKILDAAKAEVEKFKAQMKALASGAKVGRGKKEKVEGEPKVKREAVDVSGKKIKLLNVPVFREGSARGQLIAAVIECKTTDEALEYQGVTSGLIMKLVDAGYISLS